MMEHVHKLQWTPAYDKRNPDPTKNYGIGSMEARWLVIGPEGVVQFLLLTGWHLPDIRAENRNRCGNGYCFSAPLPADLGYHSRTPRYDGEKPMADECRYLDGAPCYYDGSGLQADRVFDVFVSSGEDALWDALEVYYTETFLTKGNT